jgi:hypothetical protein
MRITDLAQERALAQDASLDAVPARQQRLLSIDRMTASAT